MSNLKEWIESESTNLTVTKGKLVIDRARLHVLLKAAGLEVEELTKVEVVGIPYERDWELEDGSDGVHLVVQWKTEEREET